MTRTEFMTTPLHSACMACVLPVLLISLAGYGRSAPPADSGAPKLRLSLAASLSKSNYVKPLVAYLEKETGAKIEVTFAAVPADLVEALVALVDRGIDAGDRADLGLMPGEHLLQRVRHFADRGADLHRHYGSSRAPLPADPLTMRESQGPKDKGGEIYGTRADQRNRDCL